MRLLKMLKNDISMTTIFFHTDDETYEIYFDRNIFGKIINLTIAKNKREKTPIEPKIAKVIGNYPQNKLARLRRICFTIYAEIRYRLKQKFHHQ